MMKILLLPLSIKKPGQERARRSVQGFPSFPVHRAAPERMDHLAVNESLQKETIAFHAATADRSPASTGQNS